MVRYLIVVMRTSELGEYRLLVLPLSGQVNFTEMPNPLDPVDRGYCLVQPPKLPWIPKYLTEEQHRVGLCWPRETEKHAASRGD